MIFDSHQTLNNHTQKFCLNSKYGDLDTLTNEYAKLNQGKLPTKQSSPLINKTKSQVS